MSDDQDGCELVSVSGVSRWVFLLVPAYPGCPRQKPLNGCVCVCKWRSKLTELGAAGPKTNTLVCDASTELIPSVCPCWRNTQPAGGPHGPCRRTPHFSASPPAQASLVCRCRSWVLLRLYRSLDAEHSDPPCEPSPAWPAAVGQRNSTVPAASNSRVTISGAKVSSCNYTIRYEMLF